MPDGYLTTEQVAQMHGVKKRMVVQWIAEKDLPAEKIGGIWLIKEEDAQNYKRRPIPGRPRKS